MRYLPLVWAGLLHRPLNPILTFFSMMFATALPDLMLEMGEILPLTKEVVVAIKSIGGLGFLLITFLTCHAVGQSLRARKWEFALLRALGFPIALLVGLLFAEVAAACLAGGAAGLMLAQIIFRLVFRLVTLAIPQGPLLLPQLILVDTAASILVAFASTALPAFRFNRLNLAATLASGPL